MKPATKPTPGPWEAVPNTGLVYVAGQYGSDDVIARASGKNIISNARLIAAAPSMADAIRALLAEIDADADCLSVGAIRALRDSLAKAEGR